MTIVSTPCRKICRIEPATGLCTACGRTLAEIASWGAMSERERRAVMASLPARLAAISGPDAGPPSAEATAG